MSADAFDRGAELFERLLARPAGERAEALAAATRDDPEVRALVEGMLRGEEQVPDALDRPVAVPAELSAGALPAIEGYEVRGVLGEGGMGIVYEARQLAPSRTVALKLVRPGLVTPELVRRFRREAEVLGWLNHPGIAQVYEAGTADTPSGPRPFIAMELVRGERVDAWAARVRPPLARRLELLARLCDAVHHAHARGVVHRDLKPANVLVTEAGDLKVLDFGIARITDSDRTLSTRATGVGEVLGTLPYMAPEQVGADPAAVDTRADVYALGVLAYELLSGQRPLDVREKSLPEAARAIAEDEPTTLGALDRRLRGDVETIVGKALEKDPERRYASADELASDLRRHLADEPILARPPSRGYQLAKFARRHRGLVAGVVTAFLVLLAGAVASTALYLQKSRLLEEKSDEVRTANEVIAFLEDVFAQADPYRADELSVRDVALAAAGRVQDELVDRPAVRERLLGVIGTTLAHLQLDAEARPLLEEAAERLARRHGRADARYLDVAEDLAPLLAFEGRFDEGVALQRHVLATRRETLGDGPGVARALNVLATILARRDHDEADALLEEALALYAEHLGPDDTLTWTVRHNVAARRYAQGRYAEAEALFRAVLAAAPEELEARQVFSRLMLGNCLRALARNQEAEEMLREAERRALAAFGEAGAVTCSVRQALSGLLADTGRADEAAAMLERQLEQVERRYGRDSAQYASGLGDLAFAVHDTARREDAEALYLEAAERLAALAGEDCMERLQALHNLGILYMDLGRLERAEEVQRDVLARRRRTLGPDHPVTLTSVRGLGQLLVRTQRYEEALELRRHAYRCAVRDQGPTVPLTQTARLEVVYALIHTGGHDEAEELLDEAEAQLADQAEPDFHAVQIAKHREQLAAARATVEGAP